MYFIETSQSIFPMPHDVTQDELNSLGDAIYYSTDRNGLPNQIIKVSESAETAITNFMKKWADHPLIKADLMGQLLSA